MGEARAKTVKPESIQPSVGFGERSAFRSLADAKAQCDIFTGGPPGQKSIVLKQKPERLLATVHSMAGTGMSKPLIARRMLVLPDPDGPTGLTNFPRKLLG
jgi:hypothetical protein